MWYYRANCPKGCHKQRHYSNAEYTWSSVSLCMCLVSSYVMADIVSKPDVVISAKKG